MNFTRNLIIKHPVNELPPPLSPWFPLILSDCDCITHTYIHMLSYITCGVILHRLALPCCRPNMTWTLTLTLTHDPKISFTKLGNNCCSCPNINYSFLRITELINLIYVLPQNSECRRLILLHTQLLLLFQSVFIIITLCFRFAKYSI